MDLIVTVPDDRVAFVKKLLRELNLAVKPAAKPKPAAVAQPKKYTPKQQEWIDDFREALHEVELHQQGKIELKTLDELINELQNNKLD
jgi:hypothetical protein